MTRLTARPVARRDTRLRLDGCGLKKGRGDRRERLGAPPMHPGASRTHGRPHGSTRRPMQAFKPSQARPSERVSTPGGRARPLRLFFFFFFFIREKPAFLKSYTKIRTFSSKRPFFSIFFSPHIDVRDERISLGGRSIDALSSRCYGSYRLRP